MEIHVLECKIVLLRVLYKIAKVLGARHFSEVVSSLFISIYKILRDASINMSFKLLF